MAKLFNDKSGSWYGGNNFLTINQQKFNAKCIVKFFKNLSDIEVSNNAICAILGNISFESTVNPQLNEVGGGGYGLVQWTPKSNCVNIAKKIKQYKTYDTMYTQLCVLKYEIENNKQWIKTSDYPISFSDFLRDNTHDLEYLTGVWLKNYERPKNQTIENIRLRNTGDDSHIGSLQWKDILNFDVTEELTNTSIDGFLKWCKKIANDNTYGYKLGAGHGVSWNYSEKFFDCSSFISFGLHNGGGYDLENQFTTATQKTELEELGFEIIKYKNKEQLKRGDILFYNNENGGHTEVVYQIEDTIKLVGAHTDTVPLDEQISICDFYNSEWQYIARPFEEFSHKKKIRKRNRNGLIYVYPIKKGW